MTWLASTTLCLLLAPGAEGAAPAGQTAPAQPWELVGGSGRVRTVYVEPARMKDTRLLAQVVEALLERAGADAPLQIDFFDDRASTPTGRPWSAGHYRHHRAKFNFNPKTGMRRFVWVEYLPVDPNVPERVKPREAEEKLPSP